MRTTRFAQPRCWDDFDSVNQNPELQNQGRWPNFLHHGLARSVCFPEHSGPLSIKCVFQGAEVYEFGRRHYEVTPGRYLILNNGQRYASNIDSVEETESFVVFFQPQFAETVLAGLVLPTDLLLDEPNSLRPGQVTFFEGMYPHEDAVHARLRYLRDAAAQNIATPGWFEEQFHWMLEQLLVTHRNVCAQIEALPYKRAATRVEIYRRLHYAREYMDAHYARKLTLPEIARIACMTPHHFLRLFKQAFDETPHQYLTRKRLDAACLLLTKTDYPVSDICSDIGFESLSSFTNLFRYRFGTPPGRYRKSGIRQ